MLSIIIEPTQIEKDAELQVTGHSVCLGIQHYQPVKNQNGSKFPIKLCLLGKVTAAKHKHKMV